VTRQCAGQKSLAAGNDSSIFFDYLPELWFSGKNRLQGSETLSKEDLLMNRMTTLAALSLALVSINAFAQSPKPGAPKMAAKTVKATKSAAKPAAKKSSAKAAKTVKTTKTVTKTAAAPAVKKK
jgi:hypothetical protein